MYNFYTTLKKANPRQGMLLLILGLFWAITGNAQTVPCNAATEQTNKANGLCIGCYVANPSAAVDDNPVTYSSLHVILGLLGGYVQQTLVFPTLSQPGDSARIFLSFPVGLLDLSLLGTLELASYNGTVYNNDRTAITGGLVNIRLISPYETLVTWAPPKQYDRVEVRVNVGLIQLVSAVNIGYAHRVLPRPTVNTTAVSVPSGQTAVLRATGPAGATFRWFRTTTGEIPIATGDTLSVQAATGTELYYVQAERDGCANPARTAVLVTGRPLPPSPVVSNPSDSICKNERTSFTATGPAGGTFRWYDQPAGGTLLFTGATFVTPSLSAPVTYYVETQDSTSGVSQERTTVNVHILPPGPGIALEGSKTFGGSGFDMFNAIANTPDGGYVAGGSTNSNDGDVAGQNKGQLDWWLVKFDAAGNKVWSKTYGTAGRDSLTSLTVTANGTIVATGYFDISPRTAALVMGLDNNGNFLWSRETDLVSQYIVASPHANTVIVTGFTVPPATRLRVTEWSSTGSVLRTADYPGNYTLSRLGLLPTADKGFVIAGSVNNGTTYESDIFILRLDSNLNRQWEKVFLILGNDIRVGLAKADSGKFVVNCNSFASQTNSLPAIRMLKLDKDGGLIFIKEFPREDGPVRPMSWDYDDGYYDGTPNGEEIEVLEYDDTPYDEEIEVLESEVLESNTASSERSKYKKVNTASSELSQYKKANPASSERSKYKKVKRFNDFRYNELYREQTDSTKGISVLGILDGKGNIVVEHELPDLSFPFASVPTADGGSFVVGGTPGPTGGAVLEKIAPPSCLPEGTMQRITSTPAVVIKDIINEVQIREVPLGKSAYPVTGKPLLQAYPNPFGNTLTIRYEVTKRGLLQLRLVSIDGKQIYQLKNERIEPGIYNMRFNTDSYSKGNYILQMDQGATRQTFKLIKL